MKVRILCDVKYCEFVSYFCFDITIKEFIRIIINFINLNANNLIIRQKPVAILI